MRLQLLLLKAMIIKLILWYTCKFKAINMMTNSDLIVDQDRRADHFENVKIKVMNTYDKKN